jgi:undecaprenyl-diphosphatase
MLMNFLQILILAVIQGACELLPVSSSAHVIVAERLMGIDPTSPQMTLLLVALHTGTMLAVLVYFWGPWSRELTASSESFWNFVKQLTIATAVTGAVGLILLFLIEKVLMRGLDNAEIELLFGNLTLIACALAAVGLLIILSGRLASSVANGRGPDARESGVIGAVQGLALPFRGFSRSGATISTGLLLGVSRLRAEQFSFALAVLLTPPVVAREFLRLAKAHTLAGSAASGSLAHQLIPDVVGMIASFVAGLLALRWLSNWLERGRWQYFGYYCLFAALVVFALQFVLPQ